MELYFQIDLGEYLKVYSPAVYESSIEVSLSLNTQHGIARKADKSTFTPLSKADVGEYLKTETDYGYSTDEQQPRCRCQKPPRFWCFLTVFLVVIIAVLLAVVTGM